MIHLAIIVGLCCLYIAVGILGTILIYDITKARTLTWWETVMVGVFCIIMIPYLVALLAVCSVFEQHRKLKEKYGQGGS